VPTLLILLIIVAVVILLITNKLRPDLVAMLALLALGLSGLVSSSDLFSGFSGSVVITIMALFIITAALERTGATRLLDRRLIRLADGREPRAIAAIMVAAALFSLVMNTVAATAVLLPVVVSLSRQTGLKPSRLLIPLATGSLLGGMATIFTTANLLVSAALVNQGYAAFGILDFLPIGLPLIAIGIVYMVLWGRKLLPEHYLGGTKEERGPAGTLAETYGLSQAASGVYVKPGSPLAGQTLAEGDWSRLLKMSIVGISRGGTVHFAPSSAMRVREGDIILYLGSPSDEDLAEQGLIQTSDPDWHGELRSNQVGLIEVALAPRSPYAGKTLRSIHFREKFDLTVLALWREGSTIREGVGDVPLRFGDALLLQGQQDRIKVLHSERGFIVLAEDVEVVTPGRRAWIAGALTVLAVVLAATKVLPIAEATFSAAFLMVLFGCLSMDEAYHAIEWPAIFLIAGMLPLGLALSSTGTASMIGTALTNVLGGWGILALTAGLFIIASALAQVMGSQATAVVLAPIAIAAAQTLNADPRAVSMAVAIGCSNAFLTPFGHPSNVLVMGPGGYLPGDYGRVGLPLILILFPIVLVGLILFWGL
jgi:di/tricarboxylate transporter